ncbi:Ig-like domain-containing protein, partial [Candidatus Woesearchaeota archaeon]|nr:Ig-like domain-containing protein [Candidatus Woesearchaeota archaeon]
MNIQPTFYTIPTGTTYNFVAQGLASTDSIQLSGITFDNPAVASVSGINVKTITVRGNAVGTAAMTVTSSDSKTGTVNIAVGTGSGTSTSTNHCCIKKSGSSYTYENINPFQSTLCTELGNTYRPEPCVNAQNYACAQYCLDGGLGNNGNCNNLGNPTSPYYGICLNPTATPCVCSGPPSNANLPCESLCNTDSRVISVVNSAYSAQQIISASCQCTTNPSATNVMVQLPTAGSASNRQPIQLGMAGQNGCTNPQACWATFMTLASYSATTQTAATLPGTQTAGTWTHPNDVTASAPETTPNDYDCTLAGNATITASLGIAGTTQTSGTSSTSVSRLIQAGETVTITGKVTKMADNCKGYKYTCIRMSQKIACESKNRGLWTSLDYKTCPSDLPEVVHAEGEGTSMNWKLITTAALVIAASIASAGSATAG